MMVSDNGVEQRNVDCGKLRQVFGRGKVFVGYPNDVLFFSPTGFAGDQIVVKPSEDRFCLREQIRVFRLASEPINTVSDLLDGLYHLFAGDFRIEEKGFHELIGGEFDKLIHIALCPVEEFRSVLCE